MGFGVCDKTYQHWRSISSGTEAPCIVFKMWSKKFILKYSGMTYYWLLWNEKHAAAYGLSVSNITTLLSCKHSFIKSLIVKRSQEIESDHNWIICGHVAGKLFQTKVWKGSNFFETILTIFPSPFVFGYRYDIITPEWKCHRLRENFQFENRELKEK